MSDDFVPTRMPVPVSVDSVDLTARVLKILTDLHKTNGSEKLYMLNVPMAIAENVVPAIDLFEERNEGCKVLLFSYDPSVTFALTDADHDHIIFGVHPKV